MVLLLFGVLALAVIIVRYFLGLDPLAWLQIAWGRSVAGWICAALAAVICLVNFFLVYLKPWLGRRRRDRQDDDDVSSGLPLLGSVFILCAAELLPADPWLGALLLVLDGHGLPAFIYAVIRHGV